MARLLRGGGGGKGRAIKEKKTFGRLKKKFRRPLSSRGEVYKMYIFNCIITLVNKYCKFNFIWILNLDVKTGSGYDLISKSGRIWIRFRKSGLTSC